MVKTTDLQVIIDYYSESVRRTGNVTGKKFIYSCKFIHNVRFNRAICTPYV